MPSHVKLDPADIRIGRCVAERRIQQGRTQAQLGTAIGVTFQQVQKYERGLNRIAASTLERIAAYLDCPVANLFGESEPNSNTASARAILKEWEKLRPDQAEAILRVARLLNAG
ncbi:helix-turn-helix domain-containing protein [Brevundimonas sp.]|uniref:helix-turn-helix domain-containing protein n=1 Tax=Brevundimonas sp. TaxID=1871086 RepID=UPI003B003955